uniref:Uncharacterized protein eiMSLSOrf45 n=1 Tax=Edwardsiella phage eiMSLS TaxID=945085 RepID=E7EL40_9VIRU|nr:unknown [Edwardsiella phage eiMSLS]
MFLSCVRVAESWRGVYSIGHTRYIHRGIYHGDYYHPGRAHPLRNDQASNDPGAACPRYGLVTPLYFPATERQRGVDELEKPLSYGRCAALRSALAGRGLKTKKKPVSKMIRAALVKVPGVGKQK